MISLIIKNLPEEINSNYYKKKFNKIIGFKEIPNLITYNNDNLFYYNNFELVDKSIYDLLFGLNNDSSLFEEKDNYLECIFIEKYILINISNINSKYILEVGIINDNNINPLYLLEFDSRDNFLKQIRYVKDDSGAENYFESLNFSDNNRIPMTDENDKEIGFIYNLGINNNNNINSISLINNKQNLSNEGINQKFDNLMMDNKNKNQLNENSGNNTKNEDQNDFEKQFTRRMIDKYLCGITPSSQINSIVECFPFPPKIGLQNVRSPFYMNAILQCFCNILLLIDYFKFNSKVDETINKYLKEKKLCLTSSFKILIDNLWPFEKKMPSNYHGKNIYFIPQEFKEKISKMNDLFKDVAANDSKDLINFIIMTLHEELNETPKTSINNNSINNQNINMYNNNEVLQCFLNNFKKENSIISKEFYAVNHTLIKCSLCQLNKNNYQTYFFLIFPLEEIRKYKLDQFNKQIMYMSQNMINLNPILFQQNLQKMQNTNSVTLEDCFKYNEKIDIFQGQNAMYCNICKFQSSSFHQTKLLTGPEILIIILDRGKGREFKVKLVFDLFIDITNFIELKENNGWKYDLIGVVTHLEDRGEVGHFIAYCKSPIGGGWYQYNDELLFEVKDFVKEIRDNIMPEILFYQKINK